MFMCSLKKFKGMLSPNCLKSLQKRLHKPPIASLCGDSGEDLPNYDDNNGTYNQRFTGVQGANGLGIALSDLKVIKKPIIDLYALFFQYVFLISSIEKYDQCKDESGP